MPWAVVPGCGSSDGLDGNQPDCNEDWGILRPFLDMLAVSRSWSG